jgi:predicted AlkP superfamily phosphohydrolase/phosphomutase
MTMEKHGILDFVYLKENDLPVPFENSERREPSIWQILDHFGKRSVVVSEVDEEIDQEIREKTLKELRALGYIP